MQRRTVFGSTIAIENGRNVYVTISPNAAYKEWLKRTGNRYTAVLMVALTAAIVFKEDDDEANRQYLEKALTQLTPQDRARIVKGVEYMAKVCGDIAGKSMQLTGVIANTFRSLCLPDTIIDREQSNIWDPKNPLASLKDIVTVLNDIGQTIFTFQLGSTVVVNMTGGEIFYNAFHCAGTAESKALATIFALSMTGSLTEANVREIYAKLSMEGSDVAETLDEATIKALGEAHDVRFRDIREQRQFDARA